CEYTNLASDYITSVWINGNITVHGLPVVYNVTGGGEYCDGSVGVDVGLSGSEASVDYELLLDGNPTGNVIVGTGWAISFGNQLTPGTYTAFGLNGATFCVNDMNGSVTVSINPNPVVDAGADLAMLTGTSAFIDATVSGGTPGYTYMWAPDGQVTEDITVNPIVTTTYNLTGIDSKGCVATDEMVVTVYHNLISGTVLYDNAGTTIMNNVTVNLVDNGGTTVESTVTDATGYYAFGPHPNGTYTVEAESVKPWGGVNSTDALIVMEHFIGSLTLSGIKLIASDVNASGFTNAGDALRIAQRFAYVITSFVAGDWAFEENTIVLNEADVTNDFLALCFGDVNGSYTPPYVKVIPSVGLTNNGVIEVNDHTFEVPVTIDRDLELGAVSLIINYPAGLEIIDVKAKVEDLIYTSANGQLRISWFNTEAVNLNKDDALLTLTVKASTLEGTSFSLGNLSELADAYANVIEDASLNIPKLVEAGSILSGYSITNYPNPFNATTTIEYSIVEGANVTLTVFNLLGETVNVLVNEYQDEGIYLVEFDGSKLNSGLYYYKIETSNFVKTKTMVINK
ncbi:MAG: T9SS type A sorting domain-containing protein, partial [Bacteroidales bacterium]|nr:T9SS type A sorting domain-containing protein [Bacteroidales bacterium]